MKKYINEIVTFLYFFLMNFLTKTIQGILWDRLVDFLGFILARC